MSRIRKNLAGLAVGFLILGMSLGIGVSRHPSKQLPKLQASLFQIDGPEAAKRLSGAIKIQTITDDDAPVRIGAIHELHTYLQKQFPTVHHVLKREVIHEGALLFTWLGVDPTLKPILLMAHQDVVPIAPGTEALWTHPPFSGDIAEGYIWGRGTWDDKGNLLSILEAAEVLAKVGFHPKRTIYFAFGDDEEGGAKGGLNGAKQIAEVLKSRVVKLQFVLDEGLLITDHVLKGYDAPLALIGVAEKGYLTLRLSTEAEPGHSSMPMKRTAIGALSAGLTRIDASPFPQKLTPVVKNMFETLAPESSFLHRVILSNLWLFWPLLKKQMEATPQAAAMLKNTTAFTEFHAGNKENVFPGRADAILNFRTLPGVKSSDIVKQIESDLQDPLIHVDVVGFPREETKIASEEGPGYALIQQSVKEIFPEAIAAPGLLMASTDSYFMSELSDSIYRFSPVVANAEDLKRFHGTNERLSIHNYAQMIQFYIRILQGSSALFGAGE
jgi:carboxypeptidase PM20D1